MKRVKFGQNFTIGMVELDTDTILTIDRTPYLGISVGSNISISTNVVNDYVDESENFLYFGPSRKMLHKVPCDVFLENAEIGNLVQISIDSGARSFNKGLYTIYDFVSYTCTRHKGNGKTKKQDMKEVFLKPHNSRADNVRLLAITDRFTETKEGIEKEPFEPFFTKNSCHTFSTDIDEYIISFRRMDDEKKSRSIVNNEKSKKFYSGRVIPDTTLAEFIDIDKEKLIPHII